MVMTSADKGGRELAAAWLRRVGGDKRIVGVERKCVTSSDTRGSIPQLKRDVAFHSETQRGFHRA